MSQFFLGQGLILLILGPTLPFSFSSAAFELEVRARKLVSCATCTFKFYRHLGGETFSIMTLRITTFSMKSLFVTLGIVFSIKGLSVTLSIYDIQHK